MKYHPACIFMAEKREVLFLKDGLKNEFLYLHYLPSEKFEKIDSWQLVSYDKVKVLKVEKIKVKDWIGRIRRATKKEMDRMSGKLLSKI